MLTTLIYRSHIAESVPVKTLPGMVEKASGLNASLDVTGILLFNGTHFFQVLEGPDECVLNIFNRICADSRHYNIVELMRDYAPSRRFGNAGMELIDLREHETSRVLKAVLDKGTSRYQLTYDDRALLFLRTFVEAREKENYFDVSLAEQWDFLPDTDATQYFAGPLGQPDLSFHPIIDPLAKKVTSMQALIRKNAESSVKHSGNDDEKYAADLRSAIRALKLAGQVCPDDMSLYVNMMPMTLVEIPDAVDALITGIHDAELVPEQIVIGVSETEFISRPEDFSGAVKQLKAAGISLAIDHFGAGSAGLALLTRIQPERIRIDASITRNVHRSGPSQAVVQAIIRCCSALEITVIATGIEKTEEWMWLEAAGVIHFQGNLFAGSSSTHVAWPELKSAI